MKSIWAELEVTRQCNLRCKSCLFSCNDAPENELTTPEIMGLIDEFALMKVEWLKLTGREALLRKDVFQIIDYAKEKGLKVYDELHQDLAKNIICWNMAKDIIA